VVLEMLHDSKVQVFTYGKFQQILTELTGFPVVSRLGMSACDSLVEALTQ